jgi:hypothetical protein
MTRSTGEEWGLLVKWPSKHDAHCWLRNDDHRPRQSRGWIKYGYNRVQEIVSGTGSIWIRTKREGHGDLAGWPRLDGCGWMVIFTAGRCWKAWQ